MLALLLLTASTKSLAQKKNEICYSQKQVERINEHRIECDKCKADFVDTMDALRKCNDSVRPSGSGTAIFAAIFTFILGLVIGGHK